jgi:hypothetical protein
VIVVIGSPVAVRAGKRLFPAGRSLTVAEAVKSAGGETQIIGKVADDLAGDAIVVELGRRGIGHAALARTGERTPIADGPQAAADALEATDPLTAAELLDATNGTSEPSEATSPGAAPGKPPPDGLALEPADLKLALGYLPDIGVIVVAAPLADDAAKVVADSAAYNSVPLVALVEPGGSVPAAFGGAIVLEVPPEAAESFDRLVGAFATRLERGAEAGDALRDAVAAGGWERATD